MNDEHLELLWELLTEGHLLALTARQYEGLKHHDLNQIKVVFDGQRYNAQKKTNQREIK